MSDTPAPETVVQILAHMSKHDILAASRADIATALGISETNCARGLRSLIRSGHLEVLRRGTGPGFPTSYRVTSRSEPANPYVPTVSTLTEFLLARIAEDEAEARRDLGKERSDPAWSFAWQTPDRLLAECEAKYRFVVAMGDDWVTRVLAAVYVDHPDYREEWRL